MQVNFNMKTNGDLRQACNEAERRLDDEEVAVNIEYLQRIQSVHDTEIESRDFLHRIWNDNPLTGLGNGDYDVTTAIEDPMFRRQFRELLSSLPDDATDRAGTLDDIFNKAVALVQPYVPKARNGKRTRRE